MTAAVSHKGRLREAPKEAEPGAKKPFNPFLVSH